MQWTTAILSLPTDVLLLIIRYLTPHELLSFCSTCRVFQNDEELRFCCSYWSKIIRSTFRVPNQPLMQHNGKLCMNLYKRMLTQTHIYTWGNNDHGSLGYKVRQQFPWPAKISEPQSLGIVADLQCGGWCTVALNSNGSLHVIGYIKDSREIPTYSFYTYPQVLKYPPGYADPDICYDPCSAIRQFSTGRFHILGLSDNGRLWSWNDKKLPGLHVKFWHFDTLQGNAVTYNERRVGCIRAVKAGWDKSSAYVNGIGIVLWRPTDNGEITSQEGEGVEGVLIMETLVVPKTNFLRPSNSCECRYDTQCYGEVTNWIVLEKVILFVTDIGQVFLYSFHEDNKREPMPIVIYTDQPDEIVDVQGSFQRFAIFLRDGTVLTGHQEDLLRLINQGSSEYAETKSVTLDKIPCLQNNKVITIAFGDHHFHALHANGTITSYGEELRFCGALGLGGFGIQVVRGIHAQGPGIGMGGSLLEECYTTGRRVHFEEEKLLWLQHIRLGEKDRQEADQRVQLMFADFDLRAEVSEWFEQRLCSWEEDLVATNPIATGDSDEQNSTSFEFSPNEAALGVTDAIGVQENTSQIAPTESSDDDGLPAYFALSVAAGGLHSGALVLVNEQRAAKIRDRYLVQPAQPYEGWLWENETFPRLRLRDGREMPGTVEFTKWIHGRPDWKMVQKVSIGLPDLLGG